MAKVMMVGPSGAGKTTLARWISEEYGLGFISGSYSDLVPSTRGVNHREMVNKEPGILYSEDHQLLTVRARVFGENNNFVSDRSYIDNLAYFIVKLSKDIDQCSTESFRDNVIQLLDRDCTHLIVVPYTDNMINTWKVEDNNKRVTNVFFQWQISQVMMGLIRYFKYKRDWLAKFLLGMDTGYIYPRCSVSIDHRCTSNIRPIKVLILNTSDLEKRKSYIKKFL